MKMQILDVVVRWPGSAHDATIFANSTLHQKFARGDYGRDSALVVDSAYGPYSFACKPLADPNTESERMYQQAQISTRNIVERAFGVLKRQFPCLAIGIHFHLDKIQDIIIACCILHNYIIQESNEVDQFPLRQNEINLQMRMSEELNRVQQNHQIRIQNYLIQNFFIP